jgi:hypothetical protein
LKGEKKMSKIDVIKAIVSRTAGRSGLLLQKHSPEILMTVGVVGVIASAVMACRATLKVDAIMEESQNKVAKIKDVKEKIDSGEIKASIEYNDKAYQKDLSVVYIQRGIELIKLYGPAVSLGVVSIGCLLGAHGIMRKRNLALIAAYKAVEQSFSDYRKRVVEELGKDKDRQFRYGIEKIEKTIVDEEGNEKKETIEVMNSNDISEYAKYYDESCSQWTPNADYNYTFLKCQQNWANDLLHSRGHVFLNEVYDLLGIPRTKAGAVVGWVKGHGDDFIDFGIFDDGVEGYRGVKVCDTIGEERRDFVNGYRDSILLDFNVAGVIYDLIG